MRAFDLCSKIYFLALSVIQTLPKVSAAGYFDVNLLLIPKVSIRIIQIRVELLIM